jgi:ABC-type nitrate/sulfonate/bicarbonate transport system substrate-binding protein
MVPQINVTEILDGRRFGGFQLRMAFCGFPLGGGLGGFIGAALIPHCCRLVIGTAKYAGRRHARARRHAPMGTRLTAFLLLLGIAAISPAEAQNATLRYGQIPSTARSVASLPLFIAQRNGFFTRAGIKLDLVPIAGGTDQMVAALDRGEVDIVQTATPYLIAAVLRGSDAVAIAGLTANPIYSLIVKPEISSFALLKGKTLGLSLAIDTISISTRKLLALHGIKEADFTVKELVGTPSRLACLRNGECDGVPLGQPQDLTAVADGYMRLGISSEAVARFQFEVAAVERSWGEANKDGLTRFVGALAASFRFLRNPANRDVMTATIVATTGSSPEIASQILALYFEPERRVLPRQAEIDLEGLSQVIGFMAEAGAIKRPLPAATRFVDLQYLRAAGIE